MSIKSAWTVAVARRQDAEVKAFMDAKRKKEAAEFQATQPERIRKRKDRNEEREQKFDSFWDGMKVGYDFSVLGLGLIVSKKNKGSILDENGYRWTKKDIFCEVSLKF